MNQQELSAASAIGALYLVRMLGLFMVLPVLPLAGADIPLSTPLLIGLAIGIYGLSQGALQIPLGFLSDRIGRKPVIAGGLLVFVIGSFVAGFAEDIYLLILGRLLQGCGAVASTLASTLACVLGFMRCIVLARKQFIDSSNIQGGNVSCLAELRNFITELFIKVELTMVDE